VDAGDLRHVVGLRGAHGGVGHAETLVAETRVIPGGAA
jgi:hypothetical protein